jgi:hypothetical protein
MSIPPEVHELVERFDRNLADYKRGKYNEAQVRREFIDPTDRASHDQMVALVEQMLNLHQQLNQPQTPQAKTMLKRQIEATDRQIDKLVYELYGLTDEEIKIVEGEG